MNKSGVIGFFEEIPAFICVLIAVGIFFISSFASYSSYSSAQEYSLLSDECFKLMKALRGYEKFLEVGTYTGLPYIGRYNSTKLDNVAQNEIKKDISSEFEYAFRILDKENKKEWLFGEEKKNVLLKVKMTTAILISDNGKLHIGSLSVTVWKA
ncbi:MAG: hypothetical protein AB1779_07840 [Candidatus Thermoplasmatota archaeon]